MKIRNLSITLKFERLGNLGHKETHSSSVRLRINVTWLWEQWAG